MIPNCDNPAALRDLFNIINPLQASLTTYAPDLTGMTSYSRMVIAHTPTLIKGY